MTQQTRYLQPDLLTRRLMNPTMAFLVRRGVGVWGARELRVRGRKSGEWRTTPVNVLTVDGVRYLVSPRGHTQWSRNLRASGNGELRLGRRTEAFTAVEVADDVKEPILREYLRRWAFEVGQFFDGLTADSTGTEIQAVAADFPVFAITAA